jgi:hypothetical protein
MRTCGHRSTVLDHAIYSRRFYLRVGCSDGRQVRQGLRPVVAVVVLYQAGGAAQPAANPGIAHEADGMQAVAMSTAQRGNARTAPGVSPGAIAYCNYKTISQTNQRQYCGA